MSQGNNESSKGSNVEDTIWNLTAMAWKKNGQKEEGTVEGTDAASDSVAGLQAIVVSQHEKENVSMKASKAWKEALSKESEYRSLYRALLQKHNGLFFLPTSSTSEETYKHYEEERDWLRQILKNDRRNMLCGVAALGGSFFCLHYFPKLAIRYIGGMKMWKIYYTAETKLRQDPAMYQAKRFIEFVVQGGLSIMISIRVYSSLSSSTSFSSSSPESKSTLEMLSEIPLVGGRSALSEELCPEWVKITNQDVPQVFWDNLDISDATPFNSGQQSVNDPKLWKAIQNFSRNCIRRHLYERQIGEENYRKEKSKPMTTSTTTVVLPSRVLLIDESEDNWSMTRDEALQLVKAMEEGRDTSERQDTSNEL
jgi:hypothetical protein